MNRCPITYEPCGREFYSSRGLKMLSRQLTKLKLFPYSSEEQVKEAIERAGKMSIQGVQPKLSTRLKVKDGVFEVVDRGGAYIFKPQNFLYQEMPQNEDVTMRLAKLSGLQVPLHGMIYSRDHSLTYFIKRFDRTPRGMKFALEDFAQLSGSTRDNKYGSSMERIIDIIHEFCTFPELEKIKLFRLTVFNYLVGNEDAHLKNFSLITMQGKVLLSPCYDLVNSTIALRNPSEELALPLNGKKKNLRRKDFVDYYALTRLGLRREIVNNIMNDFASAIPQWERIIRKSFLSKGMKDKYLALLSRRCKVLFS